MKIILLVHYHFLVLLFSRWKGPWGRGASQESLIGHFFDGHPFDGQGWPSKPLRFYKNVKAKRWPPTILISIRFL